MSVFTPEDRFSVVVAVGPDKNEFYQRSTVVCRLLVWLTEAGQTRGAVNGVLVFALSND